MIKICRKPRIIRNEDRWGQPQSGYYLLACSGYVTEERWNDIYRFERYSTLPGSQDEIKRAAIAMNNGAKLSELELPLMSELLAKSKQLLWQFNLQVTRPGTKDVYDYIRTFAIFDAVKEPYTEMLELWTPEYDEEVEALRLKCIEMNKQVG